MKNKLFKATLLIASFATLFACNSKKAETTPKVPMCKVYYYYSYETYDPYNLETSAYKVIEEVRGEAFKHVPGAPENIYEEFPTFIGWSLFTVTDDPNKEGFLYDFENNLVPDKAKLTLFGIWM